MQNSNTYLCGDKMITKRHNRETQTHTKYGEGELLYAVVGELHIAGIGIIIIKLLFPHTMTWHVMCTVFIDYYYLQPQSEFNWHK